MAFKDNLKTAMDRRGMNALQLAAAIEQRGNATVLPVTIESWLAGKTRDPNMTYIVEAAIVLGVTIDSLLVGGVEPVAADKIKGHSG